VVTIYLIRHGQSKAQTASSIDERRTNSQLYLDCGLSSLGKKQAQQLRSQYFATAATTVAAAAAAATTTAAIHPEREVLLHPPGNNTATINNNNINELPLPSSLPLPLPQRVWCSPLTRAIETAIIAFPDIPITIHHQLREIGHNNNNNNNNSKNAATTTMSSSSTFTPTKNGSGSRKSITNTGTAARTNSMLSSSSPNYHHAQRQRQLQLQQQKQPKLIPENIPRQTQDVMDQLCNDDDYRDYFSSMDDNNNDKRHDGEGMTKKSSSSCNIDFDTYCPQDWPYRHEITPRVIRREEVRCFIHHVMTQQQYATENVIAVVCHYHVIRAILDQSHHNAVVTAVMNNNTGSTRKEKWNDSRLLSSNKINITNKDKNRKIDTSQGRMTTPTKFKPSIAVEAAAATTTTTTATTPPPPPQSRIRRSTSARMKTYNDATNNSSSSSISSSSAYTPHTPKKVLCCAVEPQNAVPIICYLVDGQIRMRPS
jgi:broad specificity phosphatase PhoE